MGYRELIEALVVLGVAILKLRAARREAKDASTFSMALKVKDETGDTSYLEKALADRFGLKRPTGPDSGVQLPK